MAIPYLVFRMRQNQQPVDFSFMHGHQTRRQSISTYINILRQLIIGFKIVCMFECKKMPSISCKRMEKKGMTNKNNKR